MAFTAAARSTFRSSSVHSAAAKFASSGKLKSSRSPFGLPKRTAPRIIRSPVESSFCVESLLPMHSVTASALMTSMLSLSPGGYGWIAEAGNDDV